MAELAIGSTLAGYRLDALIARGGMGVVYRATHLGLERPVALKVIAGELAGREGFRERFLRESRLAASLDHPAVVPVYDSREVDGELIVAMRLVSGGDLRKLIDREGALPPARAIALLGQVAEALDAAHAAGIVHRDVKPHNVLVEGERAFLSDFGLAKALGDSGVLSGASVVGTAEYMSPEQWRGSTVGPPADVYSLGCVLYEALTGIAPYARKEADTEPEMPVGMDTVIERAVSKDPGERYPSAGALIAAAREHQGAGMVATRVLSDPGTAPGPGAAGPRERATVPIGGDDAEAEKPESGSRLPRGKTLVFTAAGLAVIAAMVVLVLALVDNGGGVHASQPIPIGGAPLRIAADDEAIWVTSQPDGTLTRLNPESGAKVGRPFQLGAGISGVAVGAGSVWVTDPPRGEILRVDPRSGAILKRIAVGGSPGAIALGGGDVWVADEDGAGVSAVAAKSGRVLRRGLPPQAQPLRLAVGQGGLWVSSASTGNVRRIDLSTFRIDSSIPVGRGPAGVTVAHGLVWVANSRSDTVTKADPSIHAVIGDPIEVGGRPGGIDAGNTTVWVASAAEDAVTRIDLESGERTGAPIEVGSEPGAVAVGDTAVWVADNGEGAVTRIEP
ncbi:MAG TPA: serine/threonine-protein kinase [Solirubrobacterales bacterium]|nr:serine/threonine-protein kinase [Solirubrobacterales bacterium]